MALTLGTQTKISNGARWEVTTPITVDNSYPAGGWPLTNTQLGCPLGVDRVIIDGVSTTSGGAVPNVSYNKGTQTLMVHAANTVTAVGAQATATTDFTAALTNLQVTAVGR